MVQRGIQNVGVVVNRELRQGENAECVAQDAEREQQGGEGDIFCSVARPLFSANLAPTKMGSPPGKIGPVK